MKNVTITATDYHLCRNDESGSETLRITLDGSEHIKTTCPECSTQFCLDVYEFSKLISSDFDFYGTSVYCHDCSVKRVKCATQHKGIRRNMRNKER